MKCLLSTKTCLLLLDDSMTSSHPSILYGRHPARLAQLWKTYGDTAIMGQNVQPACQAWQVHQMDSKTLSRTPQIFQAWVTRWMMHGTCKMGINIQSFFLYNSLAIHFEPVLQLFMWIFSKSCSTYTCMYVAIPSFSLALHVVYCSNCISDNFIGCWSPLFQPTILYLTQIERVF